MTAAEANKIATTRKEIVKEDNNKRAINDIENIIRNNSERGVTSTTCSLNYNRQEDVKLVLKHFRDLGYRISYSLGIYKVFWGEKETIWERIKDLSFNCESAGRILWGIFWLAWILWGVSIILKLIN